MGPQDPKKNHPNFILFQKSESESVSPAEFDWGNSGLTNPLAEENGKLHVTAIVICILEYHSPPHPVQELTVCLY